MPEKKVELLSHRSLSAALAAFQADLPTIAKDKSADAGKYKYSFADLSDVSEVVLPLLGKHGLAWSTRPTLQDGAFALHYQLLHEGGESIDGVYPLPGANTPAQQLGGAITYARRYALCAVTGVAPGGDDTDAAPVGAATGADVAKTAPADWLKRVEGISTKDAANLLWQEAKADGWMNTAVEAAITKRVMDIRAAEATS